MPINTEGRRPLKSRDQPIFKHLATALAGAGVAPNVISLFSIVFGAAAGVSLAATSCASGLAQRGCWLAAAVFIQLRLIANLLDGMVAVEGRRGGATGDLWNEAPDRVADAAIFIGAGFAAGSTPLLGFGAALLAVFVAYVRALGASVGAGQIFIGPMAKQHRMFVLTVLSLAAAAFPHAVTTALGSPADTAVSLALVLVVAGCIVTAIRRLLRIADFLRRKSA